MARPRNLAKGRTPKARAGAARGQAAPRRRVAGVPKKRRAPLGTPRY